MASLNIIIVSSMEVFDEITCMEQIYEMVTSAKLHPHRETAFLAIN
jgi:hypothetical protein